MSQDPNIKRLETIMESKNYPTKEQKRRQIVNNLKDRLIVMFQKEVQFLSTKKQYENGYDDKQFCKDMTILIELYQTRLDKIKINGKFYEEEEKKEDVAKYWEVNCLKKYKFRLKDSKCSCKDCNGKFYEEETHENEPDEECESCNEMFKKDDINHTDDDRYLCDKCI